MNDQPSDPCEPDPLVGEEIIRVSLESSGIYIHLDKSRIQIYSKFILRRPGHGDSEVSPIGKTGDMGALWSSLGARVVSVLWGPCLSIYTNFGNEIVVLPNPSGCRGEIWSHDEEKLFIDDF